MPPVVQPPDGAEAEENSVNAGGGAKTPPPDKPMDTNAGLVIAFTLVVQGLTSMAMLTLPAIAPHVAAILDAPSALIGLQISLLYASALVTTILSGSLVGRWGACRVSQAGLGFVILGCFVAMAPHPLALGVTSILFGLAYGCPNPAASHLLTRFTPARHRAFIFSLKQTGVPIGGIAAGLLAPPLATGLFWQAPLLLVAALSAIAACAGQFRRRRWDNDRAPTQQRLVSSLLSSFSPLKQQPELRWLMVCGFAMAGTQLSIMTFLVVLLVEDIGLGLILAGSVLAMVQAAGVVGRLFWGWVSDRLGSGPKVLFVLLSLQLAAACLTPFLAPAWPFWGVVAVFVALGLTSIGWNGVFMAEVARRAPAGRVGQATAGAMMFTFMGVTLTPPLFSAIQSATGHYTTACVVLIALTALSLLSIHRLRRGGRAKAGRSAA